MSESDIEKTIRTQRRRMARDDSYAREQLIAAYERTIASLKLEIADFARQVDADPDRLWKRQHLARLEQILALADRRYKAFTQEGATSVEAARIRAAELGAEDAAALLHTANVTPWAGINAPALERAVGALQKGSPLQAVLDGYGRDGRKLIERKLTEMVAQGRGARKVARELERELGSGANRARLEALTRTESMRAYRTAMKEQYKTQAHLLDGLRWRAGKSVRTCLACLAMDGEVFPVDNAPDRFHVNCRCVWSPVPKGSTYQYMRGEEWLRRQSPTKQRAMFPSDAAFLAWRDGRVGLGDFVGVKRSSKWGDSLFVRSGRQVGAPTIRTPKPKPSPKPKAKPAPRVNRVRKPGGDRRVSGSLEPPAKGKLKNDIDATIEAIDRVHGLNVDIPRIPVTQNRGTRTLGSYRYKYSGAPSEIKVSSQGAHPRMTLAHEIGHFLDHQATIRRLKPGAAPMFASGVLDAVWKSNGFATNPLKKWRDAVHGSRAVKTLNEALQSGGRFSYTRPDGTTGTYSASTAWLRYATGDDELWARSYAQYVAKRSGDPVMRKELEAELKSPIPEQWQDDDFEAIAEAFDELFEALGWIDYE